MFHVDHISDCVQTSKIVIATVFLVCLYTRSAGVIYFAAGAVACSLSAKVVKYIIRQQRPEQGRGTSYGYVLSDQTVIDGYFPGVQNAKHACLGMHFLRCFRTFEQFIPPAAFQSPFVCCICATRGRTMGGHDQPVEGVARISHLATSYGRGGIRDLLCGVVVQDVGRGHWRNSDNRKSIRM